MNSWLSTCFWNGKSIIFLDKESTGEGRHRWSLETASVLLSSYGCCNKWSQMWWLRTTQIYYLTGLEVRVPTWVKRWGWFLLEALRENPFPCFFQLLEAAVSIGSWSPSIFKASNHHLSLSSHHVTLTQTPLPPSSTFKGPLSLHQAYLNIPG